MRHLTTRMLVTLICLLPAALAGAAEKKPLIQIAVLLDTSNSMDGLINQAKTQLWKIVNDLATAERDGVPPDIQVALYEYGKSSLQLNEGYLRMILPLTTDLDKVSEELFALQTNGGDEYCGWVIKSAVASLAWSPSPKDYKAIVIAGNEPFTQGNVDFHTSCKTAIEKGIVVNTIFCGPQAEGASTGWKDGAVLADGSYMNIDQNQVIAEVEAPQDKEIASLGATLNSTYVPFGIAGAEGKARQNEQDANAMAAAPAVAAQRSAYKASGQYNATGWDLVDAVKGGSVKLDEMKKEDLPKDMQGMSDPERKTYLDEQAKKRSEIQSRIARLNEERSKYIEAEMKKAAAGSADTLDTAMIKAVREQAARKAFVFKAK